LDGTTLTLALSLFRAREPAVGALSAALLGPSTLCSFHLSFWKNLVNLKDAATTRRLAQQQTLGVCRTT